MPDEEREQVRWNPKGFVGDDVDKVVHSPSQDGVTFSSTLLSIPPPPVCVCVRERERERERDGVCLCA